MDLDQSTRGLAGGCAGSWIVTAIFCLIAMVAQEPGIAIGTLMVSATMTALFFFAVAFRN